MSDVVITPYEPGMMMDVLGVWRSSFAHGLGLAEPHPIEGLRNYFLSEVLPTNELRVAMTGAEVVGILASNQQSVAALYVRIDRIGHGIGSSLIESAKQHSSGSLWLHTFAKNHNARRFYKRHGFTEVEYGFEPNWKLDDVKLVWQGSVDVELQAARSKVLANQASGVG